MELQHKMPNNREEMADQSRFEYSHFESLYKLLFQSVGVSICICKMIFDTDGCPQNYFFLDVNQGMLKATGLKRENFLGKTIRDLFQIVDDKVLDVFGKVVKSGIPYSFDKYYPELDKHFEVIGISLGNGKFAAITVDITDQKMAEWRLEELVERRTVELNQTTKQLQAVLDRISEGLYILDKNWRFVHFNKEAEKLLGKSSMELIGKDIREAYPKTAVSFEKFSKTLAEQKPIHFEVYSQSLKKWHDISVYPYEDGLAVHFSDITEKKYSRILYSFAFNSGPNAMSIANFENGVYIDVNKSFETLTGFTRDEVIGHSAQDLGLWFSEEEMKNFVKTLLAESTSKHEDIRIRTKEGDIRTISTHSELVYIGDKKIIISDFIDITEQRFSEMEMDKIERLNLIGQMAAGIGHEIRNPMTTVRGFLQILDRQEQDLAKKSYYKLMIEEIDRANSILKEYLSLAKNKIVEFESSDLNDLLGSLSPLISADALNAGMNISIEKNEIPHLSLNDKEVRQLVLNLVRNGFESMPPGGSLTVRTYAENAHVVLAVKDQGSGITPEIIDKIGTPFVTTKENGTGLGLAVCYSIAQRHNARITFDTGPDGTTFYVRFKVKAISGENVV